MSVQPVIGILALQGNFAAHRTMLQTMQVRTILVKEPYQLKNIDGLIIPGGESTAILKQLDQDPGWETALTYIKKIRLPIFGTCAGLILLSKKVEPTQFSFGWLDIKILRNGYGRQIDSHIAYADFTFLEQSHPVAMPLIRAPKIIEIGPTVTPLIIKDDEIYLVEQAHLLAATFHPELTESTDVHEYFLKKVKKYLKVTFTKDNCETQEIINGCNYNLY